MSEKLPQIGSLRHRIVIEILTNVSDGQGGQTTTWSTYATVWGLIEPSAVKEILFSNQIQIRRTHKCFIRYRSDITVTPSMRINFDSRYFQIKGIYRPDERKFFWRLDLEEGAGT